jgi:hypothetical protein
LDEEDLDFQLAPPQIRRKNAAERAIRTFKNHFIDELFSTNRDSPLDLRNKLLPQCLITLNLFRRSRINPQLSSQAHMHGAFDFNRTSLAPPGTKVLIREKPDVWETWAPNAVEVGILALPFSTTGAIASGNGPPMQNEWLTPCRGFPPPSSCRKIHPSTPSSQPLMI